MVSQKFSSVKEVILSEVYCLYSECQKPKFNKAEKYFFLGEFIVWAVVRG